MASPDALLDRLATRFSILAVVRRRLLEGEESQDRMTETDRQIAVWNSVFANSAARPRPAAKTASGSRGRTTEPAEPVLPTPERDVKVAVREELLLGWLGERLITRRIEVQGDLTMTQVHQIVDCLVPDVPLEVTQRPQCQAL